VYRQARKVALWHRLQAHRLQRRDRRSNRRRRAQASRSGGRSGVAPDTCLQGECRFPVPQSASRAARPRRAAKVMIYADPISPTRPLTAAHCTTSFRSAARPDPPSPPNAAESRRACGPLRGRSVDRRVLLRAGCSTGAGRRKASYRNRIRGLNFLPARRSGPAKRARARWPRTRRPAAVQSTAFSGGTITVLFKSTSTSPNAARLAPGGLQ
jgi:hypothetical protein